MAAPLKAAVLGVGYLGRFHAQKYAALPGCELTAVMDADSARAREVGAEFGVTATASLSEVLPSVDLVSIAATTAAHYALGLECLKAGKHVLMEKPLAATSAQAEEMVALAGRQGVVLQVGYLQRFNPAFMAVRGRVDKPEFIESIRISSFMGRGSDMDVVMDLMSHDLDLVLSMIDSPLRDLHAVGVSLITGSTDLANARLLFEDGSAANLTASRISAKSERTMRIFQKDAYIAIDFAAPAARIYTPRPGLNAAKAVAEGDVFDEEEFNPAKGDELLTEIEAFVAVIQNGGTPDAGGAEGLRTIEVAERIIAAISSNRRP